MNKLNSILNQRLESIIQQFREEIVKVYDSRNKGHYFHYDWNLNRERKGIDYNTGGSELRKRGTSLISEFIVTSIPFFDHIQKEIRRTSTESETVKNHVNNLSNIGWQIKDIHERRPQEASYYFTLFGECTKLRGISSYMYKFGEILFHQIRVDEIGHACEGYSHRTCQNLKVILGHMPSDFLNDKREEFGEALSKELLGRKIDFWEYSQDSLPSLEAKEALTNYRVKNENILRTVDQCVVLEARHYAVIEDLRRKVEAEQEFYQRTRKGMLEGIGATLVIVD